MSDKAQQMKDFLREACQGEDKRYRQLAEASSDGESSAIDKIIAAGISQEALIQAWKRQDAQTNTEQPLSAELTSAGLTPQERKALASALEDHSLQKRSEIDANKANPGNTQS